MNIKRFFLTSLIFIFLSTSLFSGTALEDFTARLENYSAQLNKVIPNAATEQNVYSDAWIGNFFPSSPMHYAIGIEGGLTQLNMEDFSSAARKIDIFNVPETFSFPTLGINGKMGGFGIPFDFGVSFFTFDTSKVGRDIKGLDIMLFVLGGNIRFAVLTGQGAWPSLSLGASYFYSNSSLATSASDSSMNFRSEVHTISGEVQLSKKFIFVTPFVGFRAIFVKADTSYSWKSASPLQNGGTPVYSSDGKITKELDADFIPQIFGGLGMTMGLIQLDTNFSYDFKNEIWNGGVSIRFQM